VLSDLKPHGRKAILGDVRYISILYSLGKVLIMPGWLLSDLNPHKNHTGKVILIIMMFSLIQVFIVTS
jgi:hypothetical protein